MRRDLAEPTAVGATFEGLARVDSRGRAGQRRGWRGGRNAPGLAAARAASPSRSRSGSISRTTDDGGTLWGNGTLDLYPAREWEPDEQVLSRLPLATEPTAIPDRTD